MAFSKHTQSNQEVEEMNLIPVMNLMMVLIPFLLLGATFFHIGVIPVSTPTLSPSDSDVPKTPTTVTCNLVIEKDKTILTLSSTSLSEEELEELGAEWPRKAGKYDAPGLQKKLIELKDAYPKSTTIIVVPADDVVYSELVELLDVMRERESGKDKNGEPMYAELFPVTVFSRFVPKPKETEAPAEEEGGEGGEGEEAP